MSDHTNGPIIQSSIWKGQNIQIDMTIDMDKDEKFCTIVVVDEADVDITL